MKAGELTSLGVAEAAVAIRDGRTTSVALTEAYLARIAEREPGIGAFAHLDPDRALADARRADLWRGTGNGTGPLHGVPVAVKDIIETADYPTENGSPIFAGRRTGRDAACVAALRSAGAIILGKTVTTELALLTPSATRNPVNPDYSPGGSSAGSAAAVADLMAPAALGSQTAGSVLRPASYCGVYGFKPTLGLISRRGVLMQSHTLDTLGLFARSLEDIALLTDCMSAQDADDPVSYPRSQPRLLDIATAEPPSEPMFAFVKTPAWETHADPRMVEAYGELVEALGERCHAYEIAGLDRAMEWQRLVQLAENAAYYGPLRDRHRELLSAGLDARLAEGSAVPVRAYIEAVAARDAAYASLAQVFDTYTAILTPAAPGPAPRLAEGITGAPIFNGVWTYLGMPAISLPLLEIDGLPVGVQLVGPRQDDGRLLRTARWLVRKLNAMANGA